MSVKQWPAVVYLPTRRVHFAYAAGSALDGSLYGMSTFCHRRIGTEEVWREIDKHHPYRDAVLWPEGKPVRPVHHCKQCESEVVKEALCH